MPNASIIQGTPIENMIFGFDRPEDLWVVLLGGRPDYIGYYEPTVAYCKEKGRIVMEKILNSSAIGMECKNKIIYNARMWNCKTT